MHEIFRDVEADPAGADDRNAASYRLAVAQHVEIAERLGVPDTVDRRRARHDARRDHHFVEFVLQQQLGGRARIEVERHAAQFDLPTEIAQRLVELLLAGHLLRDVELAADLGAGFGQRHRMAALGRGDREAEACSPAPTTAIRLRCARANHGSVSWHARGFTRHDVILPLNVWSRQAWLQPMHVLISSARPSRALRTNSASARNGRAIDTMSQ